MKDAQKIKRAQGENVKYSINNLDDVYEAIHVIQQEMKITGTTASEASQTISGSYHATMAAWSNIMTGLGTDQEMDQLIGGFVESGSNLVKNVVQLVPKIGKNVFEKAGPVISGYMSELGKKALETGSNLLANVLNGLTGDTTSGAEISAYISGVWTEAKAGIDGLISTGSGLLKGIYQGLVSDGDSKTGIVAEISGIWNEASTSVQSLIDSAGGLLGTIYTEITGQEATAENIGKTIGGVFDAGGTAISNVLGTASTFFSDLDEKLGDPDARIGKKIAGVFLAGADAMTGLLNASGTFMSQLYAAITGDTEGAAKIQSWVDDLFKTSAEIEKENAAAKAESPYSVKYDQTAHQAMMNAASSMYANPSMYGITEAQADEWVTKLAMGGLGLDEYRKISDEIGAALKYAKEMEQSRSEEEPAAPANIQITVSVNGEEVGAIIEEQVTDGVTGRVMRQFRQAGLVTA